MRFRPSIESLLGFCCPSAISRIVVVAIVYPIEGMLRARLSSHVLQENIKAKPFLADLDTSASVIAEMLSRRVFASAAHLLPSSIFRSSKRRILSCFSVLQLAGCAKLSTQASAALCVASLKVLRSGFSGLTARALTQIPYASALSSRDFSDNSKSSKLFPNHRYFRWHRAILSQELVAE